MYKRNSQYGTKHFDFILLDLFCVNLAFVLAHLIRDGFTNPYSGAFNGGKIVVLLVMDALVIFAFNTLKSVLKRGTLEEVIKTIKHTVILLCLYVLYLFVMHEAGGTSRVSTFLMMGIYFVITLTSRMVWKRHLIKQSETGMNRRSLLIVTESQKMEELASEIRTSNYEQFHVVGVAITDDSLVGHWAGSYEIVADRDTLLDYVCREWVDEVLVDITDHEYSERLLDELTIAGVVSHTIITGVNAKPPQFVEKVGGYTVLTRSVNYVTPYQLLLKRLLDIAGGIVGTLATVILTIIIGPIIYHESPGPIFFSQERVGKNGKHFKMYKFRSMYPDAEERKKEFAEQNRVKDGMMFKLNWDPRIIGNRELPDGTRKTGIGAFIRKTSIDEFPQFINVLKGDMSLVGTRPPTMDEWEKYELHHRIRMAAKPGITGMWQVSGRSEITDFEEVVRLDAEYISNWTPSMDIEILFKTLGVVLKRDGSM